MNYNDLTIESLAKMTEAQILKILTAADKAYYNDDEAVMLDSTYDLVKDYFVGRYPKSEYVTKIGAAPTGDIAKLEIHMGSQNKVKTDDEMISWFNNSRTEMVVSDKVDGSSIELSYQDGKLIRALTRGEGDTGSVISDNAKLWADIPLIIPVSGKVIVRCESYMRISDWQKYFSDSSNPRNLNNGIINRKSDSEDNQYSRIFAFDIMAEGEEFDKYTDKLKLLKQLGFPVVRYTVTNSVAELMKIRAQYTLDRPKLDYLIDGMIICINDLSLQEEVGFSDAGKKPKYSIAWKFATEKAVTTIRSIDLTVGIFGNLIPTATYDPVHLAGSINTHVLLNNFKYLEELNINIGSHVLIEKCGDIIPGVAANVDGVYECPECGFIGDYEAQVSHHKVA